MLRQAHFRTAAECACARCTQSLMRQHKPRSLWIVSFAEKKTKKTSTYQKKNGPLLELRWEAQVPHTAQEPIFSSLFESPSEYTVRRPMLSTPFESTPHFSEPSKHSEPSEHPEPSEPLNLMTLSASFFSSDSCPLDSECMCARNITLPYTICWLPAGIPF